jgi:hypothetical protein
VEDLVRWLSAQLDEEQQAAEEALRRTTTTRRRIGGQWVEDTVQPPEWRRSAWGPARVLREIDAKRKLLARYEQAASEYAAKSRAYDYESETGRVRTRVLGEAVRIAAEAYADRDGYQESWRP